MIGDVWARLWPNLLAWALVAVPTLLWHHRRLLTAIARRLTDQDDVLAGLHTRLDALQKGAGDDRLP